MGVEDLRVISKLRRLSGTPSVREPGWKFKGLLSSTLRIQPSLQVRQFRYPKSSVVYLSPIPPPHNPLSPVTTFRRFYRVAVGDTRGISWPRVPTPILKEGWGWKPLQTSVKTNNVEPPTYDEGRLPISGPTTLCRILRGYCLLMKQVLELSWLQLFSTRGKLGHYPERWFTS